MAASDIFGMLSMPNADEIDAQRQQAMQAQALQYAKMPPLERAAYGTSMGAGQLGQSLAPMLGLKDPTKALAGQQEQVLSDQTIDLGTSKGVRDAAARFLQIGDRRNAMLLTQKANELAKQEQAQTLAQRKQDYLEQNKSADAAYQHWVEVLTSEDSTPQEKEIAANRIKVLDTKAQGRSAAGGTGRAVKIDTADGSYWADPYTKKVYTLSGQELPPEQANGLLAAANDPRLKGQMSQASAGAKEVGAAGGKAQASLPTLELNFDKASQHIDELLNHPGMASAVGAGMGRIESVIPGTPAAGFTARFNQVTAESFLQSAEQLRGLGQMTEVEGSKATQAANRMSMATSEKEFRTAAADYLKWMRQGLEKARKQGALSYQLPGQSAPAASAAPAGSPQFNITSTTGVKQLLDGGVIDREMAYKMLRAIKQTGSFTQ